MLGSQALWLDTFCSASPGAVHVPGVRGGADHPGGWLRGLGQQLSEHFWWDLGNHGEHPSGPVGMQHGAAGGRPVPPPEGPVGRSLETLRSVPHVLDKRKCKPYSNSFQVVYSFLSLPLLSKWWVMQIVLKTITALWLESRKENGSSRALR